MRSQTFAKSNNLRMMRGLLIVVFAVVVAQSLTVSLSPDASTAPDCNPCGSLQAVADRDRNASLTVLIEPGVFEVESAVFWNPSVTFLPARCGAGSSTLLLRGKHNSSYLKYCPSALSFEGSFEVDWSSCPGEKLLFVFDSICIYRDSNPPIWMFASGDLAFNGVSVVNLTGTFIFGSGIAPNSVVVNNMSVKVLESANISGGNVNVFSVGGQARASIKNICRFIVFLLAALWSFLDIGTFAMGEVVPVIVVAQTNLTVVTNLQVDFLSSPPPSGSLKTPLLQCFFASNIVVLGENNFHLAPGSPVTRCLFDDVLTGCHFSGISSCTPFPDWAIAVISVGSVVFVVVTLVVIVCLRRRRKNRLHYMQIQEAGPAV